MARDTFPLIVHTIARRDNRVLLLRRRGTGFMDGYYTAPGGHVALGESVREAAVRECREEAGIAVDPSDLNPMVVMPYRTAGHEGVDFLFTCTRWHGEPHLAEPERFDDLVWASPSNLPIATVPFLALAFECERRGVWFYESR